MQGSRKFRVLCGIGGSGPQCLLVDKTTGVKCYCNPNNPVLTRYIIDSPQDTPLSCQVCEAYRQRLVAFWARHDEREAGQGRRET